MVARRAILLALVALANTWLAPRAGAGALYNVTDLGALPGDNSGIPWDINNKGQVIGTSFTIHGNMGGEGHPWLYSNGVLMPVAFRDPERINDAGQILEGRGGINDEGQTAKGETLTSGGVPIDLGDLGGAHSTQATDMNNRGQVVGYSANAQGYYHPFLYSSGHMIDLGALPSYGTVPPFSSATANAINDAGQIAGGPFYGTSHAFLYSGSRMLDLGTLGGRYSTALGINNQGQLVGSSSTATSGEHAFLYTNGSMLDLNELIPPSTGWVLTWATGINNSGQIVGIGSFGGNETRPFLLTPVAAPVPAPEPAPILTLLACLVGAGVRNALRQGTATPSHGTPTRP